jgi:hypothetical protein
MRVRRLHHRQDEPMHEPRRGSPARRNSLPDGGQLPVAVAVPALVASRLVATVAKEEVELNRPPRNARRRRLPRAPARRCPRRQDSVAHSWPKRRLGDWLNHAERERPRGEKCLQMTPFGDDRPHVSLCLTRPVTPEVAGADWAAPTRKAVPASPARPLLIRQPNRNKPFRLACVIVSGGSVHSTRLDGIGGERHTFLPSNPKEGCVPLEKRGNCSDNAKG